MAVFVGHAARDNVLEQPTGEAASAVPNKERVGDMGALPVQVDADEVPRLLLEQLLALLANEPARPFGTSRGPTAERPSTCQWRAAVGELQGDKNCQA